MMMSKMATIMRAITLMMMAMTFEVPNNTFCVILGINLREVGANYDTFVPAV